MRGAMTCGIDQIETGLDGEPLYHQPQNLSNIVLFLVKRNKNNIVMRVFIHP
jgi:hypothetical protein